MWFIKFENKNVEKLLERLKEEFFTIALSNYCCYKIFLKFSLEEISKKFWITFLKFRLFKKISVKWIIEHLLMWIISVLSETIVIGYCAEKMWKMPDQCNMTYCGNFKLNTAAWYIFTWRTFFYHLWQIFIFSIHLNFEIALFHAVFINYLYLVLIIDPSPHIIT